MSVYDLPYSVMIWTCRMMTDRIRTHELLLDSSETMLLLLYQQPVDQYGRHQSLDAHSHAVPHFIQMTQSHCYPTGKVLVGLSLPARTRY